VCGGRRRRRDDDDQCLKEREFPNLSPSLSLHPKSQALFLNKTKGEEEDSLSGMRHSLYSRDKCENKDVVPPEDLQKTSRVTPSNPLSWVPRYQSVPDISTRYQYRV
jgi:hypothetical protein